MAFWVYIMANQRKGTTYIGHTDNLYVRTLQHRDETYGDYTAEYGCKLLRSGSLPRAEPYDLDPGLRRGERKERGPLTKLSLA